MNYKLKGEDHLNSWMFFQDKAISIRGAMFNTLTWVGGVSGALFGVILANMSEFEPSTAAISLSSLIVMPAAAGFLICGFSIFMLMDSASHI